MKYITALHQDGSTYYVPLDKITLKREASDSFSLFKYQIHFDENIFDINENDFKNTLGAMNYEHDLNRIVMVQLGERL